jgi:serine/threonine protein kinase
MADIYLAEVEHSGRLVAVKEVLPLRSALKRRRLSEMLVREARLGSLVRHPNVVQVERLVAEGHESAIVMEYIEGIDLQELLKSCSQRRIPLPIRFGLTIVNALLEALDAVHRTTDSRGRPLAMVHRDVSPSNVLLGFDGQVKLCDFGIAVAMTEQDAPPEVIEGKAGYMSPEQARGEVFDPRADVYAAGIILWELLAGRRMARARGDAPLLGAARGVVPALVVRGLPEEAALHRIVRKALVRNRGERYQSAAIMRRELSAYCERHDLGSDQRELSNWLRDCFPERVAQRRRWSSLSGVDREAFAIAERDLDHGFDSGLDGDDDSDVPIKSGVRRVRRRLEEFEAEAVDPPHQHQGAQLHHLGVGIFARHALLTCALTFGLLCLLGWLGAW